VSDSVDAELDLPQQIAALREVVEKLDRQMARAGKEQFIANSLAEAQQQNLKTILDQLRAGEAARERELTQLRAQADRGGDAARLEVIERLLPVLDGLDEAIAAGESLLAEEESIAVLSFGQRAREAWRVLKGEPSNVVPPDEHWAAWLHGVKFVRERLLEVLAAEGVQPIEAVGQPFDPNQHHAVDVITADATLPAGLIAQETRRGYVCGDSVLRYAEVVVAR
jgi:molecular chaperone GrpE (heat shock protein)